ncbi:MAG: efflux RND transporter periplasmic adaptor subunit [Pseudomonadota bacterium]
MTNSNTCRDSGRPSWLIWTGILVFSFLIGVGAWILIHNLGSRLTPTPLPAKTAPSPSPAQTKSGPGETSDSFVGTIVARENVEISPKYGGQIEAVHVRLGDLVSANQKIVSLDKKSLIHELASAKASLLAMKADKNQASIKFDEAKNRYSRRASAAETFSKEELATALSEQRLAQASVESAEAAVTKQVTQISILEERLQSTMLRAPFNGTVAAIYLQTGAYVNPGQPVVRILTSEDMWIRFAVPKTLAATLKINTSIIVRPEKVAAIITGLVKNISPEVEPASQMVFVEGKLSIAYQVRHRIQSGTKARVSLDTNP